MIEVQTGGCIHGCIVSGEAYVKSGNQERNLKVREERSGRGAGTDRNVGHY